MAYPKKMREKALEAVRKDHIKTEVRKMFGLGINTLKAWENLEAETESFENRPLTRIARKIDRNKLLEYYKNHPYSTNKEASEAFNCSASGIRDAKKSLGITRKKTQYNTQKETRKKEKNS